MEILKGILVESFRLLNEMSPYLLVGFLFAGILHVFISARTVAGHLGKSDFLSVLKASLFGVPLPLCSCGVIPAAISLRREGASKGAVVSFLVSTPTTGVDSVLATYSLLGPLFAAYRVAASFLTGLFSGVLANLFLKGDDGPGSETPPVECAACGETACRADHSVKEKGRSIFRYAFDELLSDIGGRLLLGVLIGGIIAFLIPESLFEGHLGRGLPAMLLMIVVGIPMYVCAVGSIPIAAALMLKGMSPGAAFVFLLVGPATNAVTITIVGKELGKKALAVYLSAISISAVLLGLLLNVLWDRAGAVVLDFHLHHRGLPPELKYSATVLLLSLIIYHLIRSKLSGGDQTTEKN